MKLLGKLIFIILAMAGIVAIFYVSWFWRGLISVMVAVILIDLIGSFFRKKNLK